LESALKDDAAAAAYPGESATADQVRSLADEYRKAARHVGPLGRKGEPLSRAPYRLLAIQAIELYLNALLLHAGHSPATIRGMQHSFAKRTDAAVASGLKLRKRTAEHLKAMDGNREYLVSRYGPEMTATASQINRLEATLDEVAEKVAAQIGQPGAATTSARI
jgi:hypothetical protein